VESVTSIDGVRIVEEPLTFEIMQLTQRVNHYSSTSYNTQQGPAGSFVK
jgi:hypothetical protein